jgi:hypothetical protein
VRRPLSVGSFLLISATKRWTPSFGQFFSSAKVGSGLMIQAASSCWSGSHLSSLSEIWGPPLFEALGQQIDEG